MDELKKVENTDSDPKETKEEKPGYANIKPEYLIDVTENKLKRPSENDIDEPSKKKKFGQNKKRPPIQKQSKCEKLCSAYWCVTEEEYNKAKEKDEIERENVVNDSICRKENCKFSHNIEEFLKNKIPDLEGSCYNFDTFGSCRYGVACRYANCHISNNFNVRNESLWAKHKDQLYVRNILPMDTRNELRKKRYDFTAAEKIHRENEISFNKNKEESITGDTKPIGAASDEDLIKIRPLEKKKVNWTDKLYLAPLTTVGNLPFRRICKRLGADITCSEMAVSQCLLQGNTSEWALVKRHHSEDLYGIQLCGSNPLLMTKTCEVLTKEVDFDFVDINMGCPIDLVYKSGAGSRLMERRTALELMVKGMSSMLQCPLTVKMRTSVSQKTKTAHNLIPLVKTWGAQMITLHGRSRAQRYTKYADWDYIKECVEVAKPLPFFGNGDVLSFEEYQNNKEKTGVDGIMIGRGALMKPWIFTEIKESRHWDISSSERFDLLKEYVNYGLEYWGSDFEGVEKTRRFLLEWLSFLHRYIPIGLLERPPQYMNQKPPAYRGRNDLEHLLSSKFSGDWVKISEMLLGKVPENFVFLPKHKANAWSD